MPNAAAVTVVLLLGVLQVTIAAEWSYTGANGPDNWKDTFPICGGSSQSPINIVTADVTEASIDAFQFENYETAPSAMTLRNNGHTAMVDITGTMAISAGGLPGTYKAAQFHFHWGSNNHQGSEHTINSKRFPLEMHVVHYNGKYADILEARDKPQGLAVLAVLFELSGADNKHFDGVINHLHQVKEKGDSLPLTPFPVKKLLPSYTAHFYRYSGSLTTPPCYQTVIWSIFEETVQISEKQLTQFRELLQGDGQPPVNNFRPTQPLNGRRVEANFKPEGESSLAQVDITGTHSISGGGLSGTYTAAQFHFHWGSINSQGSEHTVDGTMYPIELHIVHYSTQYSNIGLAVNETNGLAVLGIFFEISSTDNANLNTVINALSSITAEDATTSITPFQLSNLLPTGREDFYRYSGSLTTPSCFESVVWTVFRNKLPISATQLAKFRLLIGGGAPIVDNFRPVQSLSNRPVRASFKSAAGVVQPSVHAAILATLLASIIAHL